MSIEHSPPPPQIKRIRLLNLFFAHLRSKHAKKQMLSNPQYFQTKINANEMPPEVSRFREANLLPRDARQIQNSKEKVLEITRQTTGRRGKC